ncbi:cardiolipin synthase [Flavivirga sp. 57AJ16]|uniref:cardiolipin synthase n=1 Tax=Flavivirga sp. 57AJ16 TaxID=3025307 RepID=UPI0023653DCE|nr:cardiolipin synthase [Flavivirga sp. 57AJ16]MDD7885428.1 cardiolipin synthase [Flavivirga sp. 57AJ16]
MISILVIGYIITSGLAFLGIIFYGARPSRSLSWLFTIVFMPYIGVVFYVLFGMNKRKIKIFKLKETHRRRLYDGQYDTFDDQKPFENFKSKKKKKLVKLLINNNKYLPYKGNRVEVLQDGQSTFSSIFHAIKHAKHFIHVQYYILEEGELMDTMFDLFKEKIKEGVEVRIMYDAIGSFDWRRKSIKRFRSIGVNICASMPLRFGSLLFSFNYRNHRKIVIIDGHIGFTGGFNLTDKYIKPLSDMGIWKDTHLKIEGPSVDSLHKVFIKDYYFASKEDILTDKKYLPKQDIKGDSIVQIVAGGPDSDYAAIMQQYIMLINLAEDYICIVNPYFIPSPQVLTALKIAALSGVKVKLLLPEQSDSITAKYSMRSYFQEIMRAGVEVYLKKDGFLHSKLVLMDDEILSVGSGNFDNRSFDHNFETNVLIYDSIITKDMYKVFKKECDESIRLDYDQFLDRPLQDKFFEGLARFLSPLL